MAVETSGAGAEFPVKLDCSECGSRIGRTQPRIFRNGEYVCGDCEYWLSMGKTPPNSLRNNK